MTEYIRVIDATMTEYTNLDGISVIPGDWEQRHITTHIMGYHGCTEIVPVRGTVGWTELGMHCRITERVGIVAFCTPGRRHWAYVLLDDGRTVDGCFHQFSDGTFSLA